MYNSRPSTRANTQMSPLLGEGGTASPHTPGSLHISSSSSPVSSPFPSSSSSSSSSKSRRRPFHPPALGILNCSQSSIVWALLCFWLLWIAAMFYIKSHPSFLDPLANRHSILEAERALARELDGEGHTHKLPGMIIHHDQHHHNLPLKKIAAAVAEATKSDNSNSNAGNAQSVGAAAAAKQQSQPTNSAPVTVTSKDTPPLASSSLQGSTLFTPNSFRQTPSGQSCSDSDRPSPEHERFAQYALNKDQPDFQGGADDYESDDAPLRQLSVDVVNLHRSTYVWGPTTKQRGVIVYMCTSDAEDVQQLQQSLGAIAQSFIRKYDYPIAIFHEDYSKELMAQIQAVAPNVFIYFVKIKFQLPKHLKPLEALGVETVRHRIPNKEHPTGFHEHQHGLRPYVKRAAKYPYGYQHMCRFFSGAGFMLPFFDAFDWYWRLDSDTVCQGEASMDVFDHLSSCGLEYSHLAPMFGDGGDVVEGLWNAAVNYTLQKKIEPKWLYNHPIFKHWGEGDLFAVIPSFNTNCEVASLAFLRSKGVQEFHRFLDREGGYFLHRWGDAPVRFLEIAMMMEEKKTEPLHGIQCYHN